MSGNSKTTKSLEVFKKFGQFFCRPGPSDHDDGCDDLDVEQGGDLGQSNCGQIENGSILRWKWFPGDSSLETGLGSTSLLLRGHWGGAQGEDHDDDADDDETDDDNSKNDDDDDDYDDNHVFANDI